MWGGVGLHALLVNNIICSWTWGFDDRCGLYPSIYEHLSVKPPGRGKVLCSNEQEEDNQVVANGLQGKD